MKTMLKILSLLAVLAIAAPHVAYGDDKPAKSDKKKSQYTALYAVVDSVTDSLLTVKAGGNTTETKFVISADTKITTDKAHKTAGTVKDVKVGAWVGGSYTKAADGTNTLHSLHTAVSQTGETGKKKEAK